MAKQTAEYFREYRRTRRKQMAEYFRTYRQRRREREQCIQCADQAYKSSLCKRCYSAQLERNEQERQRRRSLGLCVRCPVLNIKPAAGGGFESSFLCHEHLEQRRTKRRMVVANEPSIETGLGVGVPTCL